MSTCPGFGDALVETIALSFDLVKSQPGQLPKQIETLLDSPQVQKAIKNKLLAVGKDLAKKQRSGAALPNLTPLQFIEPFASPVGQTALHQAKETVKKSSEYKDLIKGLDNLKCAVKATPAGIWVNKNETLVIVILSAVALGGATVLYTTRWGDPIAKPSTDLIKNALKSGKVGSLEVKLSGLRFVPSQQHVMASLDLTSTSWTRYKTTFSFGAEVKNGAFTSAKVGTKTLIPLSHSTSLTARGSTDPIANAHNFRLTISYQQKGFSLGMTGLLDIDKGTTSGSVSTSANYKQGGITAGASFKAGLSGNKKGERVYGAFLSIEL